MKSRLVQLSALTDSVSQVPVSKIRESIVTLRTEYAEEQLEELSCSLVDQGQLQPIVVQLAENGDYELVIGSRRLRAAKRKGQSGIAAYVIEKRSPVQLLFIALAENLHRADLNPFEEAHGFLRLMKEFGVSLPEVSRGVNKPEAYVRSRLQLLSMPEPVVQMIADKVIPFNSVRVLARLPTGEDQVRFAKMVAQNHLSVSELGDRVQKELNEPTASIRKTYEFTSIKLSARISSATKFIQKIPRRMKVHQLNAREREQVSKDLAVLEGAVRKLREMIQTNSVLTIPRDGKACSDEDEIQNHRQEWTVAEIKRITSPNRPSDERLSQELGRTVAAIRIMRSKASEQAG